MATILLFLAPNLLHFTEKEARREHPQGLFVDFMFTRSVTC